ncbi:oxidoreductase [Bacillus sp. FJAT-27916]|uniref:Gfo/Idh/MocA family protein n=1 Tax=Bacillaceae TaxID=186817 RepID=UPI0006717363|nr:Gfo/Idh/MocA family oxidoreductase [Bacillus sp. FJAT-27916]KMY42846.1 oxidoreductase [Bacillus sp. FJAT-27916]
MRENLNWAVLGTGVVANEMAASLKKAGKTFYAVGNRTHSKAIDFAEKHGIGKVYNDFHEMFHDENVDIIYITTPHNTHFPFMKEALSNGKHLLVEKSITLNSEELDECIKLAEENQVVLAEAMTIFHMPIYKELKKRIDSGAMGELRMIQMNFGSYKEYDMENRFFNKKLAGGALLDIGVYAISFARWFMSEKPNQVVSQVKYAPTGVDEQAGILMMNEKQEMVTIALTLHSKQPKRGMISCDKGYIELMEYPRGQKAVITYTETGEQEVIETGNTEDALYYEMQDMEAAVKGNKEVTHLNLTKDVMDIMTEIRREWGLVYPEEEGKQ